MGTNTALSNRLQYCGAPSPSGCVKCQAVCYNMWCIIQFNSSECRHTFTKRNDNGSRYALCKHANTCKQAVCSVSCQENMHCTTVITETRKSKFLSVKDLTSKSGFFNSLGFASVKPVSQVLSRKTNSDSTI